MTPDGAVEKDGSRSRGRVWLRALGLFFLAGLTVVPAGVLVGVPLALLVVALPVRRFGLMVVGALAAVLTFGGAVRDGLWYVERGWAILLGGWFVALTLRWPRSALTPRGIGAVAGSLAVAGAFLVADPARWSVVEWLVGERIRSLSLTGITLLRPEGEPLPETLVSWAQTVSDAHVLVFPSALALASLAGLAVGWWIYATLSREDEEALGPVRTFDFSDQLVWVLIAGMALVLLGGEGGWERAGWNAVVFMGGLYVLRGLAVTVFLTGGVSWLGAAALAMGLLLLWPMLVPGAAMIGLGDTWLRFRERTRRKTS